MRCCASSSHGFGKYTVIICSPRPFQSRSPQLPGTHEPPGLYSAGTVRLLSQVLQVLGDKKLSTEEKKTKLQAVAEDHMDFATLARLTLARNWQAMSPAQQEAFVKEFKTHLSVTYGRNVDSYNNEKVQITGEREEQRGDWTIKTQILRTQAKPILVDYRVRKTGEAWKIIDVVVEGVSLV